jgi:hypothetical protein
VARASLKGKCNLPTDFTTTCLLVYALVAQHIAINVGVKVTLDLRVPYSIQTKILATASSYDLAQLC